MLPSSNSSPLVTSISMNSALEGTLCVGLIGEMSMPTTRAAGYSSATSRTHFPEPVPTSTAN